jgi:hypothetical protein
VRLYRLHTFKFRSALRKTRPLEGAAYARLKRQLNRIPAKIKRSVKALRTQEYLSVSKACASDCFQVFC